jgi:hypothetical protein
MNEALFKIHEAYNKHSFKNGVCKCGKVRAIELTHAKLRNYPAKTIAGIILDTGKIELAAMYLGYYATNDEKKFKKILEIVGEKRKDINAIAKIADNEKEKVINKREKIIISQICINIENEMRAERGSFKIGKNWFYLSLEYDTRVLPFIRLLEKKAGYKFKTGIFAFLKHFYRQRHIDKLTKYIPRIKTLSQKIKYIPHLNTGSLSSIICNLSNF